jgi:hypothetical protein
MLFLNCDFFFSFVVGGVLFGGMLFGGMLCG